MSDQSSPGENTTDEGERDLGDQLESAIEAITALEKQLGDVDALDELGDDKLESVLGDVEKLVTVADELEDLFGTLDLTDLEDAVDVDDLLESIDVSEIPDALTHENEGVTDVVDVPHLVKAINLLNAWDAADLGQVWEESHDIKDAVDEFTDDEDGGLASQAASSVMGDDGEDGLFEEIGDDLREMDIDPTDALGSIDVQSDPEAYQVFIQQQAFKGIDEFRDALLRVHGKFERLYEFNREKMRRQDTSTNSRNPTAVSTMPTDRRDLGGGARYSTVPQQVKYSTAPSRKRIYGRRFELERKRRGYD